MKRLCLHTIRISVYRHNVHFIIILSFDTKNELQCPRMTEQEQFKMSMSKSGCAELRVTVCTYNVRPSQYEPPGQNVSTVSQICLILVSNCLKRSKNLSQTCLGQNVSFGSQFETFLTFETQLRLPLFESNLRFCVVKKVSKRSQKCLKKGFGGFSG